MMLIVGGANAGKRAFAERYLGLLPEDVADARIDGCPVVDRAHELVRTASVEDAVRALSEKHAVICDEVGCGIVPSDAGERAWRERVGRMCCSLAEQADCVVRVVCGLPIAIKGSLEPR